MSVSFADADRDRERRWCNALWRALRDVHERFNVR
jgi:hypothetical protein